MAADIVKNAFGCKFQYQYGKVFYDLETMFTKLDKAELKLEELRKKDQSYTVKTHKNVPTSYELGVSKEVLNKENEHIYHRGENCERRIFAEKIIYNFANFPKKKKQFHRRSDKILVRENLSYMQR